MPAPPSKRAPPIKADARASFESGVPEVSRNIALSF
jgi:hypothetical protein